jgi:hypothetical protein
MAKGSSITIYQSMIRAPVYGLWSGSLNMSDFVAMMMDAVFTGLRAAWYAGAKAAGINADELTDREISTMQTDIFVQLQYIAGFGNFIISHSRANGGKLGSVMPRMQMWVNRWTDMYTRGRLYASKNLKYIWKRGPTEVSCGDCIRIEGKIKRSEIWIESGWLPRSRLLSCKGYNCLCELIRTDAPCTRGKLPKLG